uniref:Glutathione peroxidase n=1 Tax=Heterorhabditis bacteriophora TaxID=37862 RepID=A0A1I7XDA4_HETBA
MLRRPLSSIELKTDDIEHMERTMIEFISSQNPLVKTDHDINPIIPSVTNSVVGCEIVGAVLDSDRKRSDCLKGHKGKAVNNYHKDAKLKQWRMIIRNLPFKTTREHLQNECSRFGPFTEIILPSSKKMDGKIAGFAFVQFKTRETAEKAMQHFNENKFHNITRKSLENTRDEEIKDENESSNEINNEKEEVASHTNKKKRNTEYRGKLDKAIEEQRVVFVRFVVKHSCFFSYIVSFKIKILKYTFTIFRNLSFETSEDTLKGELSQFGEIKLALICKFQDSGHSKGTAFIHFSNSAEAIACLEALNRGMEIDGREIKASLAIQREKAMEMEKEKLTKVCFFVLFCIWFIFCLLIFIRFISPTRLVFHNLPLTITDDQLQKMCKNVVGAHAFIKECRIWRDMNKLDSKGQPKSKGFAFVAFTEHKDALTCLQKLNNNPKIFTNEKRPIIEFSIENLAALQAKERRAAHSKGENISNRQVSERVKEQVRKIIIRINICLGYFRFFFFFKFDLIVILVKENAFSKCGLTNSNYSQFKELLDKYKSQGLEVAAFPCNQFGGQEPACEIDIKNFVATKFAFEPDLFEKIDVNGEKADPLYKFLKKEQVCIILDYKHHIKCLKKLFFRFGPTTEPKDMVTDIEKLLNPPKFMNLLREEEFIVSLNTFLFDCDEYEELPHTFDDTLIDKFIDYTDFCDSSLCTYLLELINRIEFKLTGSVTLSVFLRMFEKWMSSSPKLSDANRKEIGKMILMCDSIIFGERLRPPKVISDLIRLYTTCHSLRTDWTDVVVWVLSKLPEEGLSVYIRRQMEDFLCLFSRSEAVSFISSLFEMFSITASGIILNGLSRVLLHFSDLLLEDQIESIINTIRNSYVAGDAVFKFVANINCPNRNDIHDLIADALLSPSFKLCNFVDVIDLLDEKMANVIDSCYDRLLESSSILEELYSGYPENCFDSPSMLTIKSKLEETLAKAITDSDWGLRDTAIEIASLIPSFRHVLGPLTPLITSDPSPYVRASALRCILRECYEDCDLIAICKTMVISDADPEPRLVIRPDYNIILSYYYIFRLVAIKYLSSSLPHSIASAYYVLTTAIEDSDVDVRMEMLNMCTALLRDEKYAEGTKAELLQWTEDSEIGARVRQVLGEPLSHPSEPALHILTDMISALKIHTTEGDIIDCY